ncbi:hypothetical protein L6452_08395 [Arctium lappa]|uniref:Uncharacterized protein n=1 Tax=Arctium lappa TaxID=4217 RepID=A0ACB9DHI1_ARCLA|nr:hypothetical protein L6452_08395 [Arctium lappa]
MEPSHQGIAGFCSVPSNKGFLGVLNSVRCGMATSSIDHGISSRIGIQFGLHLYTYICNSMMWSIQSK